MPSVSVKKLSARCKNVHRKFLKSSKNEYLCKKKIDQVNLLKG